MEWLYLESSVWLSPQRYHVAESRNVRVSEPQVDRPDRRGQWAQAFGSFELLCFLKGREAVVLTGKKGA